MVVRREGLCVFYLERFALAAVERPGHAPESRRARLRQGPWGCGRLVVRREGLKYYFYFRPRTRIETSLAATQAVGLREIGGQA